MQASVSLAGKSVIVIGGTAGIGKAISKACVGAGASVTVVGRTNRADVAGVTFVQCDVQSVAECRKLAAALPLERVDVLVFTCGIVPGPKRAATAEGVEMDMAVSALSRHVLIAAAAPRLKRSARVFVWGFPGSKGYMTKTDVSDLNSERKWGFETAHMNTVALNEALVHSWASKGLTIAGFNPGLIKTGIRDAVHGGGFLGGCIESCIGFFTPSPDAYAQKILPIFTALELETSKGLCFRQSGEPIKPAPEFADAAVVASWISAADALVAKVDAAAPAGAGKLIVRAVGSN